MPESSRAVAVNQIPVPAIRAPGDAEKLRLRVWLRLLSCTRGIETELRGRLRVTFETTLPRFDVLAQLEPHKNGLTMGELSTRLKVTSGNVTGLIDAMESDGFVARKQHRTDRRVTYIVATAKGRRLFAAMAPIHHGWIDELTAGMSGRELGELFALLEKLKRSTQAAVAK